MRNSIKIKDFEDTKIPEFLINPDKSAPEKAIDIYTEHLKKLVELEREHEMYLYEKEMHDLTGKEREEKGRALLDMSGRDEGEELGGYLVKFSKMKSGKELGDTEISVGNLIMISKDDPLREDNPTGTVTEKTSYSLTAAFDEKPHSFVYGKNIRLDLYVNDITFQRMKDALSSLNQADGRLAELRDIILGKNSPEIPEELKLSKWYDSSLNEPQKRGVRKAVSSRDIFLIHGPPGTGKTTTLIEIIRQLVNRGDKILATADSNIAVDNILDFLIQKKEKALRVGHPARVVKALHEHTLDHVIKDNSNYQEYLYLKDKAFSLKDKQNQYIYPAQRYRRGMSNSKIKRLARKNMGARGVSPGKIKKMAEWIKLKEKMDDLFNEAERLRDKAVREVLEKADVVCATNSTAGSEIMQGYNFDAVVIDEATQSTEPSCLIPIQHGKKIVLAGDHLQLPPTIQSLKAEKEGLSVTFFERMIKKYGNYIKQTLEYQYRMHEKIMNFSSKEFYDGVMKADSSVKTHTLNDLSFKLPEVEDDLKEILSPEKPVVFIDTAKIDAPERKRPGSTSRENRKEAEIAVRITENILKAGIEEKDIAVISPYDDQVDLITGKLDREHLEVKTVDGFQGREKEIIIISLVRSNLDREIGFLKDERRFNVSLTRAKRKLIVIGDSSTLSSIEIYSDFLNYTVNKGLHLKL